MTAQVTAADVGRRVKAVSTHEDGTRITYEGVVTDPDSYGFLVGERFGVYVYGSDGQKDWTVVVEVVRPPVPTGLGAVVRLDGDDGPLAVRGHNAWDTPLRAIGRHILLTDDIAARIHAVLSEGVEVAE